jgi:energy-converting hydrogenase B subunit F
MIFTMGILLIVILFLGLFPDVVVSGITSFVGGILLNSTIRYLML